MKTVNLRVDSHLARDKERERYTHTRDSRTFDFLMKKEWQCLGGPVQSPIKEVLFIFIYLFWSAIRLFMVLMALTITIILSLIFRVKQGQTIH